VGKQASEQLSGAKQAGATLTHSDKRYHALCSYHSQWSLQLSLAA